MVNPQTVQKKIHTFPETKHLEKISCQELVNEKFTDREPECFISGFTLETDVSGSDATPLEGLPDQVAALGQGTVHADCPGLQLAPSSALLFFFFFFLISLQR